MTALQVFTLVMAIAQPMTDADMLPGVERAVAVSGQGYFPVLCRLDDGRLGAVVRGGAPHIGVGGRLDWIESADGGGTWSAPRTIVDSEWDDRNPALGQTADGTLCLAYAEAQCYNASGEWDPASGEFVFFYVLSFDAGKTWTPKQPLLTPFPKGGSPYGRIVMTAAGEALMSVYGVVDDANAGLFATGNPQGVDACGFLRSSDNGRTWGAFTPVARGYNEMTLLPLPNGGLLAFARSDSDQHVAVLRSEDSGMTWSEPVRVTLGSQHPAAAALLAGGDVLVVYGNRLPPYGVQVFRAHPDVDMTSVPHFALAKDSRNGDQGYPSVVVRSDGMATLLYYAVGTDERPSDTMALRIWFDPNALPPCMGERSVGPSAPGATAEPPGEGAEPYPTWLNLFPWTTREIRERLNGTGSVEPEVISGRRP